MTLPPFVDHRPSVTKASSKEALETNTAMSGNEFVASFKSFFSWLKKNVSDSVLQ